MRSTQPFTLRRAPRAGFAQAATLVLVGILAGLVLQAVFDRYATDTTARQVAEVDQVRGLIERTFVQPRDSEQLLDGALRGMLGELDPYSKYYDNTETGDLERQTSGLYDGIGVLFAPIPERWRILHPLPESPALAAGFRVGDLLVTINGEPAAELELEAVRAHFADGSKGPVAVEVEGLDGERRELEVQPARTTDPTVRRVRMIDNGGDAFDRVGYASIGSFSRRTPGEFDEAVDGLRDRGARRLVIDLRGNRGGVLGAALAIANRFVEEGALLQTESRAGLEVTYAQSGYAKYADMSVAVLMDGISASASEVLAGALQDHRAAVLVGERSYGKGTVQSLTPLHELDGVVRITTAVYRTPSGRLIERSLGGAWKAGLEPDLAVTPASDEQAQLIALYLSRYGPPLEHLSAVLAWQESSGLALVAPPPPDPVLDAALELLAGRRPVHVAESGQ
ncbi:S41 family peptidase [Engelhardtia mirabilis]|uniref:S41 family peptidase n=1 Tax=Engelhardtia mirabilis TaxID=2528011 RepID=UPI0011A53201